VPAAGRESRRLTGAPRSRPVLVDGHGAVEHRLDDPLGCLDRVLAGEQARVAVECVAEQPLVGCRQRLGPMVANGQLDLLAAHRFAGRLGARLQRDDDLG
jgi:hypothetical protein